MKPRVVTLGTLLVLLASAAPAAAAPQTTVVRTIADLDGDNLLEYAPGEDHLVIGAPEGFRPPRQGSILSFLQLSDFQIVDEESPGRVEFLDTTQRGPFPKPFSAAYRPQESLTTQVTEAMVRAARNATSPVTGDRLDLAILTGDNADSQQYNETRWFIDILDGQTEVDPDSGIATPACPGDPDSVYDGVRGGGKAGYYEPDSSGEGTDGDGYSPDRAENAAEGAGDVTLRDFPGLLERAQSPFRATGLGLPWYTAFGNHDALIQGNSPDAYFGPYADAETARPDFQRIATGCEKVMLTPTSTDPENVTVQHVPPDARRCYLAKDDVPLDPLSILTGLPCGTTSWINEHFNTTGTPVGHGFAPAPCEASEPDCAALGRPMSAQVNDDGYYSFAPRDGLRFIALDTVTDECGVIVCSEGSVDDAQFRWLRRQLEVAEARGEYVVTYGHHTLATTRFFSTDPSEYPMHYGNRFLDEEQPNNVSAETLEDLFCHFPNLLLHLTGHEHGNDVRHHDCTGVAPPGYENNNPFYEVVTAAHVDWPQQARMIEFVDNADGTMSAVLTVLDHEGPPNPGGPGAEDTGQGEAGDAVARLAGIARELAYNDYQNGRGSSGSREDRNVIIVLDKPWPYATD